MKSRRMIFVLALVLVVAGCRHAAEHLHQTPAQPTFTAEDESAIGGMLEKYVDTVVAENWPTNLGYYTADAVRMPPGQPMLQGHPAITAWLEALPPVTGFSLSPDVIAGDGDLAYARGAFTFDLAPPDAEPVSMVGKWHAIYKRQADGSWLCVSDIWNSDAPMAM